MVPREDAKKRGSAGWVLDTVDWFPAETERGYWSSHIPESRPIMSVLMSRDC